jgi:hypothetical protein
LLIFGIQQEFSHPVAKHRRALQQLFDKRSPGWPTSLIYKGILATLSMRAAIGSGQLLDPAEPGTILYNADVDLRRTGSSS